MGLFRRKTATIPDQPLPEWNDTRWRSHLRAHTTDIDHHCNTYLQFIKDDRKEAARLFKNDDTSQARSYAKSSLRHHRIVYALTTLSSISNQLYQRTESLAGFTTLFEVPEPARSALVTIIFVAGRLHMKYLKETVNFLRQQFGPLHVDAIQKGDGELYAFVNHTVRESLSPASASQKDIDTELASAVREYFGMSTPPPLSQGGVRRTARNIPYTAANGTDDGTSYSEMRRSQTTPVSVMSSEVPVSPQISDARPPRRMTEEAQGSPPGTSRVHGTARGSSRYHGSMVGGSAQQEGYQELTQSYTKPQRGYQDPESKYRGQDQGQNEGVNKEYGGHVVVGRNVRDGGGVANLVQDTTGSSTVDSGLMRDVTTNLEEMGASTGAMGGRRMAESMQTSMGRDSNGGTGHRNRAVREEFRLPEHLRGFSDSDEMLLKKYDHLCGALLT